MEKLPGEQPLIAGWEREKSQPGSLLRREKGEGVMAAKPTIN